MIPNTRSAPNSSDSVNSGRRNLLSLIGAGYASRTMTILGFLGAAGGLTACKIRNRREELPAATGALSKGPQSIEKGDIGSYVIEYSGITDNLSPAVTLEGAPIGVRVISQTYDSEKKTMTLQVEIPKNIVDSTLTGSFVSRHPNFNISQKVAINTSLKESSGPILSPNSPTTLSVPENLPAEYRLSFDEPIKEATLGGDPVTLTGGNDILIRIAPGRSVGTRQTPLVVKDGIGNSTTTTLTLNTTDATAPRWINQDSFPGELVAGKEVTVSLVFDEPIKEVVPSIATLQNSSLSLDGKVLILKLFPQAPGPLSGNIRVSDLAGNPQAYTLQSLIVDRTAPELSLQSRPGSVTKSTEAIFDIASSEPLQKLEYSTDGGKNWILSADIKSIKLTGLSDGTQQIRLRGTDTAGNPSTELAYTWLVDTTAPALTAGQTQWKGTQGGGRSPAVPLSLSEAPKTANWIEKDGSGITLGNLSVSGSTITYDMSYDATTPPGTYTFSLRVEDEAGNEALIPITLTVEKKNTPTIAGDISGPSSYIQGDEAKAVYSVTPVDPDGIESVTVSLDGGTPTVLTPSAAFAYEANPPASLAVGKHTVTFSVTGKKPDGKPESPITITKEFEVLRQDTPLNLTDLVGPDVLVLDDTAKVYTFSAVDPDGKPILTATINGTPLTITNVGGANEYAFKLPGNLQVGANTIEVTAKGIDPQGQPTQISVTKTKTINVIADAETTVSPINGPDTITLPDTAAIYSVSALDPNGLDSVTATIDGEPTPVTPQNTTFSIKTRSNLSLGTHTIVFSIVGRRPDGSLAPAKTVTKTITVTEAPDTEKPVITLNGDAVMTLTVGQPFVDPGWNATDNRGSVRVETTGTVDTQVPGTYTITYRATDTAGNTTTVARTVIVVAPEVKFEFTQTQNPVLDAGGFRRPGVIGRLLSTSSAPILSYQVTKIDTSLLMAQGPFDFVFINANDTVNIDGSGNVVMGAFNYTPPQGRVEKIYVDAVANTSTGQYISFRFPINIRDSA